MPGAVVQLVAKGAADTYLTGNPQISYFKMVYHRHTNFAMEWIRQKNMTTYGVLGKPIEVIIDRVGDLLGATHLELTVPALQQEQPGLDALGNPATSKWVGFCNSFMHAVVRSVEWQINGTKIDKQYGDWLEIWSEISIDESKQAGYNNMIGKWNTAFSLEVNALPSACRNYYKFRLPLQFWFCRNPGCALPLIALQYHEMRLIFDIRGPAELIRSDVNIQQPLDFRGQPWNLTDIAVWSNYYFLDTEERRKFAQQSYDLLIDQLQYNTPITLADGIEKFHNEVEFNHPLKELFWVIPSVPECGNSLTGNDYFNYSTNDLDTFYTAKLVVSGVDRFEEKDAEYFRNAQTWEHHTRIPTKHLYVYSFGLRPEEIQPSGTLNASRMQEMNMVFTFGAECCYNINREIRMYARNFNLLRIMSGMGGLAFSN
jgi:hypothetical protein